MLAGIVAATPTRTIVEIHMIGPISPSNVAICIITRQVCKRICRHFPATINSMIVGISSSADMVVVSSLPASPLNIIGQIHLVVWLWRQSTSLPPDSSSESSMAWSAELILMSSAVSSLAPPFSLCAASNSLYLGCRLHKFG
jgi:hypothetical protein